MDRRISSSELLLWKVIPTAVISDEQNHSGILDPDIRSLSGQSFAGQAHTIRAVTKPNPAAHWTISIIQPGDVIMMDGRAFPRSAIWGGNMMSAAVACGLGALIVDGNVRDGGDLKKSGVAVYARRVQATGWHWGGIINDPIECGGIEVAPGDLIVGDADGVAVIKLDGREDLMRRCLERISVDERFQAKVRTGQSSLEILQLPPFSKGSE